jgi:hypothetical protein
MNLTITGKVTLSAKAALGHLSGGQPSTLERQPLSRKMYLLEGLSWQEKLNSDYIKDDYNHFDETKYKPAPRAWPTEILNVTFFAKNHIKISRV